MILVSNDTLLWVVRRYGRPSPPAPKVIDTDDWPWRRNQRYGAITFATLSAVARSSGKLLPDGEPSTTQAWLAGQPQITIVARDRGGFAIAVSRALPHALQVADRWHLMENASAAFLGAVRKSMRQIRSLRAAFVDPARLTAAERLQYALWCSTLRPHMTSAVDAGTDKKLWCRTCAGPDAILQEACGLNRP